MLVVISLAPGAAANDAPSSADAVRAFLTARQWVSEFDVPELNSADAAVAIDGASGAYIALRQSGRVAASGIDTTADDRALRRAAGRALSELLGDPAVRNMPESLRPAVGSQMLLELELAGPLQPVIARTTAQLSRRYEPGLDGLAMRRGESLVMLFPAQLRRTGNADNLDAAVSRLAASLQLKAAPLSELIDRHNVSLYRFRTIHLVQNQPSATPMITHRGQRIVSVDQVTPESISAFADAAAQHLINKLWAGDEPLGLLGDYDSLRDQYQPLLASARDQALTALALNMYAATTSNGERSDRAADAARSILTELAVVDTTEASPFDDPAACALILAGMIAHTQDDEDLAAMTDRVTETLAPIARLQGDELHDALRAVDPATRGMIALAMYNNAFEPAVANRVLRGCFDVTNEQSLVAMMPWAYMALQATDIANAQPLRDAHSALDELRLALWNQQIKQATAPRAAEPENADWIDLVGGFSLQSTAATPRSRPTAQSIRAASLLTLMLDDQQFTTTAQQPVAEHAHRLAMRYLMQLQVADADTWALRNPDRALGGIRASTWSSELPTAATAMALITAVLSPPAEDVREPTD